MMCLHQGLLIVVLLASQAALALGFSSTKQISPLPRYDRVRCLALQAAPGAIETETVAADVAGKSAVNELAAKLLRTCAEYGQVGSKMTEEQRATIDELASSLAPFSDPAPAQIDLEGKHELIYSASPSASSGALGPLVGKVTQSFLDDTGFINRVEFFGGVVKIELLAERKVLDENRIRVMFKETTFEVFGNEVKKGEVSGAGVWDYIFSGNVEVEGEKMLLRVMNTPSTFVIVQKD